MKRLLASMVLIAAVSALAGCYYDPGYSYVRGSSYGGDAYYGQGGSGYIVSPGDYGSYYPNYYPGYYGGYNGYGCCYAPGVTIGLSRTWYGGQYGGQRYRGYRNHDYRGHRGHRDYRERGSHGGRDHGYRGQGNAPRPRAEASRARTSEPRRHASPRQNERRNDALRSTGPGTQ